MQFADLPNLGHNLRLYTYDPVGSQYGPPSSCPGPAGATWVFNTGHFDISLGVPCSQPDPQGFCDWNAMSSYAAGRGEMLVMVTRGDLTTLCAYRAPITVTTAPVQNRTPTTNIMPVSGGVTGASFITGVGSGGSPAGYIPSPGTPIDAGGTPAGVGNTPVAVTSLGLYRFILYNPSTTDPNNPYSTGANYPGCSEVNSANCHGMNFPTEQAAVDYAEAHQEIPYRVLSASEVWGILNGTIAIDPKRLLGRFAQGLPLGLILAAGLGLWFLSGR